MSYIEREALKEHIGSFAGKFDDDGFWVDLQAVLRAIDFAPTADVVEVVRCKDCKKWEQYENTSGAGYCHNKKYCFTYCETFDRKFTPITMPEDFCSYGERREKCETD